MTSMEAAEAILAAPAQSSDDAAEQVVLVVEDDGTHNDKKIQQPASSTTDTKITDDDDDESKQSKEPQPAAQPKKRILRRRRRTANDRKSDAAYQIDPVLLQKVLEQSHLPSAYSFEIVKTVQRCVQLQVTHLALQMPEGLLLYATVLADVLRQLTPSLEQVSVLGDVTYGACCVDDLTAHALGCQLLVHYGHSCLVPLQHTAVPCLYVFVEIQGVAVPHLVECLERTLLPEEKEEESNNKYQHQTNSKAKEITNIYLLGTVQFRHALATAQELLTERGWSSVEIPQVKPLSPGEVLGCTSPVLPPPDNASQQQVVCFIADGRFHLEATLIANPHIGRFYRYDPYSRTLTEEAYGMFFCVLFCVEPLLFGKKSRTLSQTCMFASRVSSVCLLTSVLSVLPSRRPRPDAPTATVGHSTCPRRPHLWRHSGHAGPTGQPRHCPAPPRGPRRGGQAPLFAAPVGNHPRQTAVPGTTLDGRRVGAGGLPPSQRRLGAPPVAQQQARTELVRVHGVSGRLGRGCGWVLREQQKLPDGLLLADGWAVEQLPREQSR